MRSVIVPRGVLEHPSIVIGIVILIVIVAICISNSRSNKRLNEDTSTSYKPQNRVSSSKDGVTFSMQYDGDVRYVDGIPISTFNDYIEWSVIKGFSMSLGNTLRLLENDMEEGKCLNYADARKQWDMYYNRLRELCIRHKLWNPVLEDRCIFTPTSLQLEKEKQLFQRIDTACELGINEAYQYTVKSKEILDYIASQPNKVATRVNMVNKLAGSDVNKRAEYRQVCRRMVKEGILSETRDKNDKLALRKKRARRIKNEPPEELPPSCFSQSLYQNVDFKMLCKVKHTVSAPISVDHEGRRCEFQSLSQSKTYKTSLSQCTCQAFKDGFSPCKHMVALAKYLGYI